MKCVLIAILTVFSLSASANEKTTVTVESLTNGAKSTVLEACGTATHADGIKPLLVTVKHDLSNYTTITNPDGKWCVLFLRWTNSGKIDVSATTLNGQ
jgi:hypothetical protein